MMTSRSGATEAYVWIWLPGETEPVVAGRLTQDGDRLLFIYGASYRRRKNAIPIYEPELPLRQGVIEPLPGLSMPSCNSRRIAGCVGAPRDHQPARRRQGR